MNPQIDEIIVDGQRLRVLVLQTYSRVFDARTYGDKFIKERPVWTNLTYSEKNIIWRNDVTQEIGFVGIDFSYIFKLVNIVRIEISNILPAKGPGGMEFNVILNPKKIKFASRLIYLDSHNSFDSELAMIEKFTGLNIECFEVYDC